MSIEPRSTGAEAAFAPFWEAWRNGELRFPFCPGCSRFHWYPMSLCPHCRRPGYDWRPVGGRGRIFTYTIVHHAFAPEWRERLPYVLVLVELDEAPGVRLVAHLDGIAPEAVRIGLPVQLPAASSERGTLVTFEPAPSTGPSS